MFGEEITMEKAGKTIITVVGKDTVGIIARVCTYLAENKINILDISQTIVQGSRLVSQFCIVVFFAQMS